MITQLFRYVTSICMYAFVISSFAQNTDQFQSKIEGYWEGGFIKNNSLQKLQIKFYKDEDGLKSLAAQYLLEAKTPSGAPLDPVARFHLGNGAQVLKVHAAADTSENGMRQSAGAMVNYLYDLSKISRNHERFALEKKISASSEVRSNSKTGAKLLEKKAPQ